MLLDKANRYSKAAMIAVALFLAFDLGALALNFWLSYRIERQAIAINLAGRQRMLTQRMIKALLLLEEAQQAQADTTPPLDELSNTYRLFDDTLKGFTTGYPTQDGAGQQIFLRPVESKSARQIVQQTNALWQPYSVLVQATLAAGPDSLSTALPAAAAYARAHNLQLLEEMNQLTTALEKQTQSEASEIRLYQGAAFVLAMCNFLGASWLYARRIREAKKHQGLLDDILNKVSASVLVLDKNKVKVLMANHSAERLFQYDPGRLLHVDFDTLVHNGAEHATGQRSNGTAFPIRMESTETYLADQPVYIVTVWDITQQRASEAYLSELAYQDALTRLPNRVLFNDRLRMQIAQAHRQQRKFGLLFIDLDKFKSVNDTYGHHAGDLLLQAVAQRLRARLREGDTLARLGGDEFAAILVDAESHEDCTAVAQSMLKTLSLPVEIEGAQVSIGGSIGIGLYPKDGTDIETLLHNADMAMYHAKDLGRGQICLYTPANGGGV